MRSSAPAEKVQAVEDFINTRLSEIGMALQSSDSQMLLMLALLNTVEELLELRTAGTKGKQAEDKISSLLQQLEIV